MDKKATTARETMTGQRRGRRFLLLAVSSETGMLPEKLVIPVALAASCAFMLPVTPLPNAIVYGSGMVSQKEMIRAGLRLNLILGAVLVAYTILVL